MSTSTLKTLIIPAKGIQRATVVFLHGSGDSGEGILTWIRSVLGRDLQLNNTKIIFPTAPLRPYTPMNGALSNVWFDRVRITSSAPESVETIDEMCNQVGCIINDEVKNGIPMQKIVIGGFSMGGGLAYHLGYRFFPDVAGVFTLSSFVNDDSQVLKNLKASDKKLPPLFCCHGKKDELVLYKWGHQTVDKLTALGVSTQFHSFPDLNHELGYDELQKLQEWISSVTGLT